MLFEEAAMENAAAEDIRTHAGPHVWKYRGGYKYCTRCPKRVRVGIYKTDPWQDTWQDLDTRDNAA
jgi:hypothetical protein